MAVERRRLSVSVLRSQPRVDKFRWTHCTEMGCLSKACSLLVVEILLMQMLRPLNCLVLHEKLRLRFNLGEVLLNGRALRVQDLLVQVVDVLGLVIGGDADKHWLQLV